MDINVSTAVIQNALSQLDLCQESLDVKVGEVEKTIVEHFEGLIDALRQCQTNSINQLHNKKDKLEEILKYQRTVLEQSLASVLSEEKETPSVSSCPLKPLVGDAIDCLKFRNGSLTKDNIQKQTGFIEDLPSGLPIYAELDKGSFLESQTLSGTVHFVLKDFSNQLCLKLREDLISILVDEPRNAAVYVHPRTFPSVTISIISTEAVAAGSKPCIRLFYDGLELKHVSDCGSVVKHVDEGIRWLFEGPRMQSPIFSSYAYLNEIFITTHDSVQVLNLVGKIKRHWGQSGSGPGDFKEPRGIVVSSGGEVFVADSGNDRIQVFDANGLHLRECAISKPKVLAFANNLLWVTSEKSIIALNDSGSSVHEIVFKFPVSAFSFMSSSEMLVYVASMGWRLINLNGEELYNHQQFKSNQYLFPYGDFVYGISYPERCVVSFNRCCFAERFIFGKSKKFSFSTISISLLEHGKLVITGSNSQDSQLAIIDCGHDFPLDSNRLYLFKFIKDEAERRNLDLKHLCKIVVSMCLQMESRNS
jgi:hypothetical protein